MKALGFLALSITALALLCVLCGELFDTRAAEPAKPLDPAAWGSDHVGKPLPEYVTGDECLFCHRMDIGPTWGKNRHQQTVREVMDDSPVLAAMHQSAALKPLAKEARHVMGGPNRQRLLKPAKEYGKLELLSAAWVPPRSGKEGELVDTEHPHWDGKKFGDACAGCHATAVDSKKRTFSALALDCYACHGDVSLQHSKDSSLIHLARKKKDPARVVTSICAQCHVRTGKSASTGLPYPNNFVAGDNLFRDFKVDLSEDALQRLNPGDRHVLENVRDVVLLGKEEITCLTCHDVHKQSARKHHRLDANASCQTCHNPTGSKKERKPYEVHSATCGY